MIRLQKLYVIVPYLTIALTYTIENNFVKQSSLINGHECNFLLVSGPFTASSKLSCAEECTVKKDICFYFTYNMNTSECRLHYNVITDVNNCVTSQYTVHYKRKVDETSWPRGSYGLMKTIHGCPGSPALWTFGFRTQDTEGLNDVATITNAVHLYGSVTTSDVTTAFCMKIDVKEEVLDKRPSWPMGSYCILKSGACPPGLSSGFITWDDEDVTNTNVLNGSAPDGVYNNDTTTIYYCCRNDSNSSSSIVLPINAPFVLLKKGLTCQKVQGMTVVEEWIEWETEGVSNGDMFGGNYPDLERITIDLGIKLFFCYYS